MSVRSGQTGSTCSAPSYWAEGSDDLPVPNHAGYSHFIDNVPAILWRANAQTLQFTLVSRNAETLLGYPTREWGEPSFWIKHLYTEDREYVLDRRAKAAKDGELYDIEYRLTAPDGR